MRGLILAAEFLVAATTASWAFGGAPGGFNPGTGVGNVMDSVSPFCGFGLAAPDCGPASYPPPAGRKHKIVRSGSR